MFCLCCKIYCDLTALATTYYSSEKRWKVISWQNPSARKQREKNRQMQELPLTLCCWNRFWKNDTFHAFFMSLCFWLTVDSHFVAIQKLRTDWWSTQRPFLWTFWTPGIVQPQFKSTFAKSWRVSKFGKPIRSSRPLSPNYLCKLTQNEVVVNLILKEREVAKYYSIMDTTPDSNH